MREEGGESPAGGLGSVASSSAAARRSLDRLIVLEELCASMCGRVGECAKWVGGGGGVTGKRVFNLDYYYCYLLNQLNNAGFYNPSQCPRPHSRRYTQKKTHTHTHTHAHRG